MRIKDVFEIDYLILLPVMLLMTIGIVFIYSSGVSASSAQVSTQYIRQIIWASAGVAVALTLAMVNYRRLYNISPYIYLAILIPLVYTLVFGRMVRGAPRWLRIGTFGIQVSEFAKIAVIIFLARYLDSTRRNVSSFVRFLMSCLIVIIPMGIVLLQPDLGTSLVFIPILLAMTFVAGLSTRYLIFLASCIMLTGFLTVLPLWESYILRRSLPALGLLTNPRLIIIVVLALSIIMVIALFGYRKYRKKYFYWMIYAFAIIVFSLGASFVASRVLRSYQLMRLIVFLDPNVDPRGAGWNIIQSITAIGSGGFAGKGLLQGTQGQYRFLPEQSTDFIFSLFSEEAGFIGGIVVFILFMIICLRFLRIITTTSDPFAAYICAGLVGMYSFHFMINVGMTMGIMPITGIPLVFMSYGGSSMISSMIGIGIAMSIYVRRYVH